jgi:putative selenate reductase
LRKVASAEGLDGEALVLVATRIAGRLNGRLIVPGLAAEDRYHDAQNRKPPRQVDSVLDLYDCLNCDLCVAVCPNDAIFVYETEPASRDTEQISAGPAEGLARTAGEGFRIETDHQIAVFADVCNECSNCETYCPEEGAPFQVKERIFVDPDAFEASGGDGFLREGEVLAARLGGQVHRLTVRAAENRARLASEGGTLEVEWEPLRILEGEDPAQGFSLDTAQLWRMKTVWTAIYHSRKPNPGNP